MVGVLSGSRKCMMVLGELFIFRVFGAACVQHGSTH